MKYKYLKTTFQKVASGVLQGSVIGRLLFFT